MQNKTEYFNAKMNLLNELFTCTEEIMTAVNLDKWEDYEALDEKRIEVIESINALEENYKPLFDKELSPSEKSQINNRVSLLIAFDEDVRKRLNEEKEITLKNMKAQMQNQTIIEGYKAAGVQTTGIFIDTKK